MLGAPGLTGLSSKERIPAGEILPGNRLRPCSAQGPETATRQGNKRAGQGRGHNTTSLPLLKRVVLLHAIIQAVPGWMPIPLSRVNYPRVVARVVTQVTARVVTRVMTRDLTRIVTRVVARVVAQVVA
jgi:hypothetical protein